MVCRFNMKFCLSNSTINFTDSTVPKFQGIIRNHLHILNLLLATIFCQQLYKIVTVWRALYITPYSLNICHYHSKISVIVTHKTTSLLIFLIRVNKRRTNGQNGIFVIKFCFLVYLILKVLRILRMYK